MTAADTAMVWVWFRCVGDRRWELDGVAGLAMDEAEAVRAELADAGYETTTTEAGYSPEGQP